jgi:hypothetical protein
MIWGGVWGALGLVLPLLLHPLGLGSLLMPMFLPLLIAAGTLRLQVSLTLSVAVPLISSLLTGMPPLFPPVAFMMMLEALVMSLWLDWSYRRRSWNLTAALIAAFLLQRAVRVIFVLVLGRFIILPENWLIVPALIWGYPGALVQIGVIPWIIKELKRARL